MSIPAVSDLDWSLASTVRSYPEGEAYEALRDGHTLLVGAAATTARQRWQFNTGPQGLELTWRGADTPTVKDVLAALEATFTFHPFLRECTLAGATPWPEALFRLGALRRDERGTRASREMLWQLPALWCPGASGAIPLQYALSTQGRRHPLRAPKPQGLIYQRYMPWLGKTFSFRAVDPAVDLARIHRWMNEPAVAQVWQEDGDLDKHRRYLAELAADPHIHSMIASLDGEPFGYFEVYWAKENRVAPFYDVDDYDRGWHVLIGEPAFRGKAYATAWLTAISHYLFLDDPRTQRAIGEPRADHVQQIRNLDRSGYAKVKEFDFPHKRAMLVSLLRERYFTDALWWPRVDAPASPSAPLTAATPAPLE
ncbi:Protein N-acetyltransferase, RimJ/RimL family [Roseateles sp. YR242]|uniref:GNAT family N-acetyltransferase n=1 Tax=Roseateles sp. YR242 TaxID=1855305 RepID=UPI0008BC1EB8|nr:GNAT family N-acetyltransferase [Roseateles sp. YR242]SEL61686.1 Protein N-acetyltransferase, RimJ/RimL family [Roseateles sp. YR242]